MIKCEVIENFTLEDYNKLKNVKKVSNKKDNEFSVGDTFECDEEMAKYLLGDNVLKKTVVKVIEVEKKEQAKKEVEKVFDDIGEVLDKKIEVVEVKPKKNKSKK
jgi:hypothetical protein